MDGEATSSRRWAWLAGRPAVFIALGLALLVNLPALSLGFAMDDYVHRGFLLSHLAHGGPRWWAMFDVCHQCSREDISARIAAGLLPWWTLPTLSISLFRPLSVATHYLDYLLWPNAPAWMHAHNLAWYLALVWLVWQLYRRLLGPTSTAGLAALLYAIDEAHVEGTSWIAGRNTLVTAVGVMLTLVLHDRARRDGSRASAWLAPFALLASFAAGEGAIAAWAFLVPYALWLDARGSRRERLGALAPLGVVTLGWQALYRALGYGAHGSGVYRDPIADFRILLAERVPHVFPQALAEQFGPSTTATLVAPWLSDRRVVWAGVLVAAASLLLVARWTWRRRDLRFWWVSLLGGIAPLCAIGMSPRLLFLVGVPAFALIAESIVAFLRTARDARAPLGLFGRAGAALLAAAWTFVHGPLALFAAARAGEITRVYEALFQRSANALPPFDSARTAAMFVVNTPNYLVAALSPLHAKPGTWPARSYVLGAATGPVHLSRPDRSSLVLEPEGGYLLESTSQLVRAPEYPFRPGERIAMGAMTVTVEATTSDGRPARVRFQMTGLDDPRCLWVAWHDDHYELVRLPPVGGTFVLAASTPAS